MEILSLLERSDIPTQWDFDVSSVKSPDAALGLIQLSVLLCPDDDSAVSGRGDLSYVVNGGFGWTRPSDCPVAVLAGMHTVPFDLNGNGVTCPTGPQSDGGPTDRAIYFQTGLFFVENWPVASQTPASLNAASAACKLAPYAGAAGFLRLPAPRSGLVSRSRRGPLEVSLTHVSGTTCGDRRWVAPTRMPRLASRSLDSRRSRTAGSHACVVARVLGRGRGANVRRAVSPRGGRSAARVSNVRSRLGQSAFGWHDCRAAAALHRIAASSLTRPRLGVLTGAALLWSIVSALAAYPHCLSYCNELAGRSGEGWYAISVNLLHGLPCSAADGKGGWKGITAGQYSYFRAWRPAARAGYSIRIYHRPPSP